MVYGAATAVRDIVLQNALVERERTIRIHKDGAATVGITVGERQKVEHHTRAVFHLENTRVLIAIQADSIRERRGINRAVLRKRNFAIGEQNGVAGEIRGKSDGLIVGGIADDITERAGPGIIGIGHQ